MDQEWSTAPAGAAAPTSWSGVILSALLPVATSMTFFYQSLIADWRRLSDEWIFGLLLLVPLEFIRALILYFLGDAYKASTGPMQATKSFLLSIAILLVAGIAYLFLHEGVKNSIGILSDPNLYNVIGLPILVMVADSVIGIFAFGGVPRKQATALDAVAEDSIDWLNLATIRVPLVILPLYGLLAWAHSAGWRFAEWVPTPSTGFGVRCALFYIGCYFLGKAAFVANVQTAHFAATGKRLLDTRWMTWVRGKGNRAVERSDA